MIEQSGTGRPTIAQGVVMTRIARLTVALAWVVSEMNYKAWNLVDTRTVRPGRTPVVAFIYGKA